MADHLRQLLVARGVSEVELEAEVRRKGLPTLRASGLAQVALGATTLDEVLGATVED